jgi:hypothetical protein
MTVKLSSPHLKLDVLSSEIYLSFNLQFHILESKTSKLINYTYQYTQFKTVWCSFEDSDYLQI